MTDLSWDLQLMAKVVQFNERQVPTDRVASKPGLTKFAKGPAANALEKAASEYQALLGRYNRLAKSRGR